MSSPARIPRIRVPVAAAVAVVVLALCALVFYRWGAGNRPQAVAPPSASPSPSRSPTAADVYTAVAPSVVSIEASHAGSNLVDAGTGVIVNADGTVLTAYHVVKGASAIKLTFADGTAAAATVSSADPASDTASLAPAALPSVVVPAVLGSSTRLAVGDGVIAIGDQLGLTRSTTTGVVSGLNRTATNPEGGRLGGLIQFDAAVNPGSSGGPLVDGRGETVGIVVALANPTGADAFSGVGFAVPIGTAAARGGGQGPQQ
jgi:putative serine protease PepD